MITTREVVEQSEREGAGQAPLHFDVVIIGAGISGIDAAYRIQRGNKKLSYVILEGRKTIGGTWDLFRYPGIRSDSDMATLGFPFHPWREENMIAGGTDIRNYVERTARTYGIDRHIRYDHKVVSAQWSTEDVQWTVVCDVAGTRTAFTCGFLYSCTGYYDYKNGYAPQWQGMANFAGTIVYPQFWPSDLDYGGKRVVVVGSGATAVTIVPAMAATAAHVTMLQRSPSYIISLPSRDKLTNALRKRLPQPIADTVIRWKNIALSSFIYVLSRKRPERVRKLIRQGVIASIGPAYDAEKHDVDTHFNPKYNPWDQRLCLVPDGDLFKSLASGKASVETGTIAEFTANGVRLESGKELPADIVVSATGLMLQLFGGVELTVDGRLVDASRRLVYKGSLVEGVPNFAFSFGYTNASWTLKVDLNARFVSKLLRYMRKNRKAIVVPKTSSADIPREPLLNLSSGYVRRAAHIMPQQGPVPWRVVQNYFLDFAAHLTGRFNDGTLHFYKAPKKAKRRGRAA